MTLPPRGWREQRKEQLRWKRGNGLVGQVRRLREDLPRTCTGGRRRRTGSDTARLHHTPAPGPLLGTGSLVSEVHCPDTSPDLSCQKNKPTIGLFLTQRRLSVFKVAAQPHKCQGWIIKHAPSYRQSCNSTTKLPL